MDEFGVLTERYGLKPQGKSAPMAASKSPANPHIRSFGSKPKPTFGSNSYDEPFFGDNVMLFSNSKPANSAGLQDDFDIFGGFQQNSNQSNGLRSNDKSSEFGFPADFMFSSAKSSFQDDDIFGVFNGSNSVKNADDSNDIFGQFESSKPGNKQGEPIGDLLGDFGVKLKPPSREESVVPDDDDLLSGIGLSNKAGNGGNTGTTEPTFFSADDPFMIFESTITSKKSSFTDPLEEMSKPYHSGTVKPSGSSQLKPPPKPGQVLRKDKAKSWDTSSVPGFEDMNRPGVARRNNVSPSGSRNGSSTANLVDDLPSLFQDASLYGQFEEVEGESEERRRARWERLQRTGDRVAKAVADMNHRDHQTLLEQQERSRIAESVDFVIKRWVAGKEGNMRALLSSLQHVLWPDCGWEPVSLTDLITSSSVKKVYRKAALCVHPDKVQQKGATVEQKYTAEKVFDILKEAWNKFNKEELS